jgi:hypothetical protein
LRHAALFQPMLQPNQQLCAHFHFGCLKAVQDVQSLTRISLTPVPMLDMGFQSLGSSPH